jgi:hypothetical protein
MARRSGGLTSFSQLEIGGGMTVCAAIFAVLLVVSGPSSTTFEWGMESLIAGFAVAGFFVLFLAGLTRLLHLNPLTSGLWMTFLALALLVWSFLPPINFYEAASRGSRPEYLAFTVFSGGWYLLILGLVMLSSARKQRRQGRPSNAQLYGVLPRLLDVGPAGRGGPFMPPWPGLGDVPSGHLLNLMTSATARPRIAGIRSSTLVIGHGVLKVAIPG